LEKFGEPLMFVLTHNEWKIIHYVVNGYTQSGKKLVLTVKGDVNKGCSLHQLEWVLAF
jgi:hypothetical protein